MPRRPDTAHDLRLEVSRISGQNRSVMGEQAYHGAIARINACMDRMLADDIPGTDRKEETLRMTRETISRVSSR